jgi:hypothetical protein
MALNKTDFNNLEKEFCYFWDNKEGKYALVKSEDNSLINYSIFSMTNYFFVMLDVDKEVGNFITDKMVENNVMVFESFNDFMDYQKNNPVVLPRPMGYPPDKEWYGDKL